MSRKSFLSLLLSLITCVTVGCTSQTATTDGPETSPPPATVDTHAGHAHPSEGPHHGELIELGNEEYHAELLHDAQSVTIYVLDGAASKQVAIDATEIVINSSRDGQPTQFTLAASPDADDPAGKSSRFVSSDPDLPKHLDGHEAQHRLVLTIEGKSYRGDISHSHDH